MQLAGMKKDAAEKKTRQGLSLSPELLAAAKVRGRGNLSAYIRGLIERDLAGESAAQNALSQSIIVDLAEELIGKMDAGFLDDILKDYDQRLTLQEILQDILTGGVTTRFLTKGRPSRRTDLVENMLRTLFESLDDEELMEIEANNEDLMERRLMARILLAERGIDKLATEEKAAELKSLVDAQKRADEAAIRPPAGSNLPTPASMHETRKPRPKQAQA